VNTPLISIIVPSYNQGAYIANTLLSIARQDYAHWEVIIQDGASKDNTADEVRPFLEKDKRITFYSEKDKGFSDAVNKALKRCNGEFAIIQNSDDFFSSPTVFSEAINYISQYPDLYLLSSPFKRVDGEFKELLIPDENAEAGFIDPKDIFSLRRTFGQSSTFFSMKRIRDIGGLSLNVDMVADTDTWIRISTYEPMGEKKIYFAKETWSCATYHPAQRSNDQAKFMMGRAQMFTDLLFDARSAIPTEEKKRFALLFVTDAFEYLIERNLPTEKVEVMFKQITGNSIPLKKKLKQEVFRIGGLRKLVKGEIKADGTDYFLSLPRGKNYSWFK